MAHRKSTTWWLAAAVLSLCTATACFTPEPRDTRDDDDDDEQCQSASDCGSGYTCEGGECMATASECSMVGNGCETNGDCCDFDGTTDSGAGLCVNYGGAAVCTNVCRSHSDCDTGCCGSLESEDGYGACASASVCENDSNPQPSEQCIAGVFVLCACAAAADVPCSEENLAAFLSSCDQEGSELVDSFECYGTYADAGLEACSDAIDQCGVKAEAEPGSTLAPSWSMPAEQQVSARSCGFVERNATQVAADLSAMIE